MSGDLLMKVFETINVHVSIKTVKKCSNNQEIIKFPLKIVRYLCMFGSTEHMNKKNKAVPK